MRKLIRSVVFGMSKMTKEQVIDSSYDELAQMLAKKYVILTKLRVTRNTKIIMHLAFTRFSITSRS